MYFFSPFKSKVRPKVEPHKVKLSGNGVSPRAIPASLPTEFLIDTSEAGDGDLKVDVMVSFSCKFHNTRTS